MRGILEKAFRTAAAVILAAVYGFAVEGRPFYPEPQAFFNSVKGFKNSNVSSLAPRLCGRAKQFVFSVSKAPENFERIDLGRSFFVHSFGSWAGCIMAAEPLTRSDHRILLAAGTAAAVFLAAVSACVAWLLVYSLSTSFDIFKSALNLNRAVMWDGLVFFLVMRILADNLYSHHFMETVLGSAVFNNAGRASLINDRRDKDVAVPWSDSMEDFLYITQGVLTRHALARVMSGLIESDEAVEELRSLLLKRCCSKDGIVIKPLDISECSNILEPFVKKSLFLYQAAHELESTLAKAFLAARVYRSWKIELVASDYLLAAVEKEKNTIYLNSGFVPLGISTRDDARCVRYLAAVYKDIVGAVSLHDSSVFLGQAA